MQRPTRADFRAVFDLALPLATVQVGLMAMGVVDTMMVGRFSAAALAGTAVANVWFFAVSTIGMGCIAVLDPVISQAHGASDEEGIARGLQRGFLLALVLTVPTILGNAPVEAVMRWTGQPDDVVPLASEYMVGLLPGILPFYGFMVVREALQAVGAVRPLLVVIVLANVLNAAGNRLLIFGEGGFPALGVTGAALATTISRWAMLAGVVALGWRHLGPRLWPLRPEIFQWAPLARMLGLGLPIGFQILFEYGVFGGVGLLMGRFGTAAVAGHQIALNLAALAFMVPFGVGAATSVLVGRAVGAERPDEARRRAAAGLIIGGGFMVFTATAFLAVPRLLAAAYTPDPAVAALAAALIPLAGAFQVFDGIQAVALGALRGVGDTRVPVLINLTGYYLVGLPIGLWLGFGQDWGPRGLWWGLVAGLMAVATVLVGRVRLRLGRDLARLRIDHPPPASEG
ncbi:MAG: MATE family efflux transporter [Gemmatimonadales bacterium]|nr:MATE family efflux transporter [Gemmatimonadales bacterium]